MFTYSLSFILCDSEGSSTMTRKNFSEDLTSGHPISISRNSGLRNQGDQIEK